MLLVLGSALRAQDVQRFSERQIIGTARYVGMGGAMTAIGGDPSAALDNPAGLGLYRQSEITLTIDETIDNTTQLLNNSTQPLHPLSLCRTASVGHLVVGQSCQATRTDLQQPDVLHQPSG